MSEAWTDSSQLQQWHQGIEMAALLNQGMILVGWASCPPRNIRDGQDAHSIKQTKSSRKYATPKWLTAITFSVIVVVAAMNGWTL